MTARRIDGRAVARRVEDEVGREVRRLEEETGGTPRLDVVLVGDDPASHVYVRRKTEAAGRVGIRGTTHRLPPDATQRDVEAAVDRLNELDDVHGILLQLPLPDRLSKARLLDRIDPAKDVDCFHPHNLGLLLVDRIPMPPPTAQGVITLLEHEDVDLDGAEVVIVNHSNLIGKPLAALFINRDATVAVCHKSTKDLREHTRRADVLVSGTGVPGLIKKDDVKPGAVVVDIGFARRDDGSLTGDVDQEGVSQVAGAITPVPGGVGPVTVAMLLRNVATAYRLRHEEATEAR